jgi:hypothetical protein
MGVKKIEYYGYEVRVPFEQSLIPFDQIVKYVKNNPGTRCFIAANHCTKEDIDTWLNDDKANVYWWENLAKLPAIEDIDPETLDSYDVIELLSLAASSKRLSFAALIEVFLPVDAEKLCSLYYPKSSHPTGELLVTCDQDPKPGFLENFRAAVDGKAHDIDVRSEAISKYLEDIFGGWAKFTYTASLESGLNADERWETVLIPTYSNIDSSFIEWGELLSSSHTEL